MNLPVFINLLVTILIARKPSNLSQPGTRLDAYSSGTSALADEGLRLFLKRDFEASVLTEDMAAMDKLTTRDETVARIMNWAPWLAFPVVSLPPPLIFLVLFFGAATTEASALYLFLTVLAAGVGAGAALLVLLCLLFYRKRWLRRLRDRLAANGITVSEVSWFLPELTTSERQTLKQFQARSPLLADAYCEILASRLMATRLIRRSKRDLLLVERRLNRLAMIQGTDTSALEKELRDDQIRLTTTKQEATARLAETQARMQMIEATASRDFSHGDTYTMLQRLTAAQDHLPLTLEMAQREKDALSEAQEEVEHRTVG
jgi:hypothetical protein